MRRLSPEQLDSSGPPRILPARTMVPRGQQDAVDAEPVATISAAELAMETSRQRGYAEGMKAAEQEIERRYNLLAARLDEEHKSRLQQLQATEHRFLQLMQGLGSALARQADETHTLSVEVAVAAVVRLLGDKADNKTLMPELCQTVIREFGHPPATLRVSESDFALIAEATLNIPVEVDRQLSPGQCVVDTARGQFESGLDVRLEALCEALLAGLADYRSAP